MHAVVPNSCAGCIFTVYDTAHTLFDPVKVHMAYQQMMCWTRYGAHIRWHVLKCVLIVNAFTVGESSRVLDTVHKVRMM